MKKLSLNLENAFGIEKLSYEFNFENTNTYAIYARNGLMKTSFAKTFLQIQKNKVDEIKDKIFDIPASIDIKLDGNKINKDDVFVIQSYDALYEADISPLLVNNEIKELIKDLLKSRDKFIKQLEKISGVKVKKTNAGVTSYELEETIVKDFDFSEKSIVLNLNKLKPDNLHLDLSDVVYSTVFDPTNIKKIKSPEFQDGIKNFMTASEAVYNSFEFLEKGKLTYPKLLDLKKNLDKDGFFVKDNQLILAKKHNIKDINSLEKKIEEIETEIKKTPEMQAIEKLLQDSKGTLLKDIIETHPEIVEYLMLDKLSYLKKLLWLSYIKTNQSMYDDLCEKYSRLETEIANTSIDDTEWKKALDIFNERFTVPFSMDISNLKSSIIGEEVPHVDFIFNKGSQKKVLNKSEIDALDTLSQGEKRALYLLNIVFDVENIKKSGKETLVIVDDIADSFDYKNKYAIIEYLYELSKEDKLKLIILSHNFDFYRAVSSRLGIDRKNHLFSESVGNEINLVEEKYQKNPFEAWKKDLVSKYIIALIPFVRNLIQYGNDKKINTKGVSSDFLFMTSLLHEKADSQLITFKDLKPVYYEYIGNDNFKGINDNQKVIEQVLSECNSIKSTNVLLEDRIILSMGIRHLLEKYILGKLPSYASVNVKWKEDTKTEINDTVTNFLLKLDTLKNQTAYLIEIYRQVDSSINTILDRVKIMTPENIHLNSFMYEPLIDMDINELLSLYNDVKAL